VRKRAVLLDLDDTLLDERPGRVAAREGLLARLGEARPELSAAELAATLDRETRWFWADAGRHASGRLDLLAARRVIVARTLQALGAPDAALADAAARRYMEVRDLRLAWMPGAPEALAALRAAVPRLALLTNGAAEAQRAKLARFDLARFFDHVQIEGAFGEGKPSPAAFRHALAALGAEPEQAVMVGNDFEFDVLGALGAGLDAVWIDIEGEGAPASSAPRGYAAVRSIREVPALLGATTGRRKRARLP
jgi:putative hydrolase of the HAD superfamily